MISYYKMNFNADVTAMFSLIYIRENTFKKKKLVLTFKYKIKDYIIYRTYYNDINVESIIQDKSLQHNTNIYNYMFKL